MKQVVKQSFINTLLAVIYISLVALFLTNAENWFGSANQLFGVTIMLMLFSLSALVVGGLLVVRPLLLYIDGKKKEAVSIIVYSAGWLFMFVVIALVKMLLLF